MVNLERAHGAKVEEGVSGSTRDFMKAEPNLSNWEVLAGMVERVTYQTVENGFCVIRVKVRGHRELVTVVGHVAAISAGEWITATGEWFNDRTQVPQDLGAHFDRRDRKVSCIGDDSRHRPGLRQEAPARLRREGVRRHRGGASATSFANDQSGSVAAIARKPAWLNV